MIARAMVEVAYARPDAQVIETVALAPGASVGDAIAGSTLPQQFPEIDLASQRVGIFGQLTDLSASVGDGDRVEIYRPLQVDPKEVRRERARHR